jgi:glycosyltransferase involved in cell wall biosynthesis
MKIGLIARADNSGLGIQTLGFYKHMNPAKTMVVDISDFNHNKVYLDRYPGAQVVHGFPRQGDFKEFLEGLDAVFIAESAYNPLLYTMAREMGVKVANQYNYEFFDWFKNPDLPTPDMFIAPSMWHYETVDEFCRERGILHKYLHCPVDRGELPFYPATQVKTFLHVAGRSAAYDRNGTETVIRASRLMKSDAKILIHFQGEQGLPHQATRSIEDYRMFAGLHGDTQRLTIEQVEYENYADVYKQGDVMVLPRRYGGNCLPVNEALSSGMPVIMPNLSPNNWLLPDSWLVPAKTIGYFTPRTKIDIYEADPQALADTMDRFADMEDTDVVVESAIAAKIAQEISWEVMAPKYREAFEELCSRT